VRRPAAGSRDKEVAEVGNDQLVGIRRRQFAAGAIAQKMVEVVESSLLTASGPRVAHIGMLKFVLTISIPSALACCGVGAHRGRS